MSTIKLNYTREELIDICERAVVKEEYWWDRDTESSQCRVGECWALLRAGCDFEIDTEDTSEETIWLNVYSQGFGYFDYGGNKEEHHYYLPTLKRLAEANGKDWY